MQLTAIADQVVVLFGASSGIGRAAALKFAQRGAKVVLAARGHEGLDSLLSDITSRGGTATAIPADTADYQQVAAVAEQAVSLYGRIDTWVHLAGVSIYAPFELLTPEEFKQVIDVNLMGQIYGAMAALPHLRRTGRGGALIHISSVLGKRSVPYQSPYCTSKHGLDGFLESLRLELQRDNAPISVTNIMPASINTPFYDKALTKLGVKPRPIPPVYAPDDVADAILYAAENPVRDIVVGGGGYALLLGQRLSPPLIDAFLLRFGFETQKSNEPASVAAPNSLFQPIAGYDRVEGDFGDQTQHAWTFAQSETNPFIEATANIAVSAVAVAATGAAIFAGAARLLAEALRANSSSEQQQSRVTLSQPLIEDQTLNGRVQSSGQEF